jgi:CheY-like chemotaxis protein
LSANFQPQRAILLVEDQKADAVLIERALVGSGLDHPIHCVHSGIEALAYLSGDPPFHDRSKYPLPILILLEIRMPGGPDGFEVLRWIRHHQSFSKVPVAMLTGSTNLRDANTAYRLGANTFLVKPFDFVDLAELSNSVKRLIAKAGAADE